MSPIAKPVAALDEPDRLYLLRKLGIAVGALPSPPRLAEHQPAIHSEQRRLDLERSPEPGVGIIPSIDQLIALAPIEHDLLSPSPRGLAGNLADGWLLFAYGGVPDIIEKALHRFAAVSLVVALRSRDPQWNHGTELAAAFRMRADRAAREADAVKISMSLLTRHRSDLVQAWDARSLLTRDLIRLHRDASQLEEQAEHLARTSLSGPRVSRIDDAISKPVADETALERDRWWGPIADTLHEDGWSDSQLAELVMTGATSGADKGLGWAFPLCPLSCAKRSRKTLASSINKERTRRERRNSQRR